MAEKIRLCVIWIALADSWFSLMYNYSAWFCSILKNYKGFVNYLKKSFQWRWSRSSNSCGLEMANIRRCLCRSHQPFDGAPANFLVTRFHDLHPLTPSHHYIDTCMVNQPFYIVSENIYICLVNDHLLWFQRACRWPDIFFVPKVNFMKKKKDENYTCALPGFLLGHITTILHTIKKQNEVLIQPAIINSNLERYSRFHQVINRWRKAYFKRVTNLISCKVLS